MTDEEAVDILDDNFTVIDTHGHFSDEEVEEARQLAIKALQSKRNMTNEVMCQQLIHMEAENERLHDALERLKQQPCEDCISRKAIYEALYERFHDEDAPNNITEITLGSVRNFVKDFPPVTPQQRKAKWIKEETIYGWDGSSYQCSICGRSIHIDPEVEDIDIDYPYCHCGAKMEVSK